MVFFKKNLIIGQYNKLVCGKSLTHIHYFYVSNQLLTCFSLTQPKTGFLFYLDKNTKLA